MPRPDSPEVTYDELPTTPSPENAAEFWYDYFNQNQPRPSAVGDLVLRLHDAGHHEQVIAIIQSALVHGQFQPWMYQVLALTMEIAGRPKDEVERVLLSQVDFTAVNVPSMLYSAAFLTRFGGKRQALKLYRQASALIPTRPEPYVLGLKLARELQEFDAIRWAAAGVLTYAWVKGHDQLHREAENAALEAQELLQQQGRTKEAETLQATITEARKRDLILRLTWSGEGDLDLIVEEPLGTVCSFENPQTRGGGAQVHDGFGPDQDNCYEEYVCAFAIPGTYRVRVRYISGQIVAKRAQLTVIRYQGTAKESIRTISVPIRNEDQVVRVPLQDGRRNQLMAVPPSQLGPIHHARNKGRLRQRLRVDPEARAAARNFARSRRQNAAVRQGAGVGFQPIITTISEGVAARAMAVVSGDRRYVRISTSPIFSSLTDVFTFSFFNPGGNQGQAGGGGQGAQTP